MCFVTAASQEVIKKINEAEKPQGASGGDGLQVDRLSVGLDRESRKRGTQRGPRKMKCSIENVEVSR